MAGTAAGAAAFNFPMPAIAQAAPFKLGLLTVKTGPLAQGGIQMEQGIVTYLKEKNYTFAGSGIETWNPVFRGQGFRRVQVSGFPGRPALSNFEGLDEYTAVRPVGSFSCSNARRSTKASCSGRLAKAASRLKKSGSDFGEAARACTCAGLAPR